MQAKYLSRAFRAKVAHVARMKMVFIAFLVMFISLQSKIFSAEPKSDFKRPEYIIYRAATSISIDGKLDETAWKSAPEIDDFKFPWWKSGKKEGTVAKMLWDDQYLYVAHICEDSWITARCREHDGPVSRDDCFEVMVAPNINKPMNYYNIEWNVLGTFVDGHRVQKKKQAWDASDVRISGKYVGTLNDDTDVDQHWVVEVAIPFKNFENVATQTPPRPGYRWNLNLNRHGGDSNMQYSSWSKADTPAPAFHTPHRFGRVIFSADKAVNR